MAEHPPAAAVDAEALSEEAAPPALQPLGQALAGEVLGTYLLVLFGAGSVAAAVLTGAQQGLWQVAVVWGFGVTLAIYASAALSGAHLNPAVSLAFALCRDFPARRLAPYIAARDFGPRLVTYALGWGDIGDHSGAARRLLGLYCRAHDRRAAWRSGVAAHRTAFARAPELASSLPAEP